MDVQDKIEQTGPDVISFIAGEYSEVFDVIRKFTESDLHAWFVVWELMRYWEYQEARKKKGSRPATGPQLQELKNYGIRDLSDLSQEEAVKLLSSLDKTNKGEESEDKESY